MKSFIAKTNTEELLISIAEMGGKEVTISIFIIRGESFVPFFSEYKCKIVKREFRSISNTIKSLIIRDFKWDKNNYEDFLNWIEKNLKEGF